jgi:hypothetical protein
MNRAVSFRVGVPVQIGALYKVQKAGWNTSVVQNETKATKYPDYPLTEMDLAGFCLNNIDGNEVESTQKITNQSTRSQVIEAIIKH